jgi:hypothetical protein
MKKFASMLTALFALCIFVPTASVLSAQSTYNSQSGVTLFTAQPATATATSTAIRLPNFVGTGTLNITEAGVTGSPSGCTIALAYQQSNTITATAAVATIAFTPSTGTQQLAVTPSVLSGDSYVATYACSSTYPTAGTLNVTFSPAVSSALDPCSVAAKASVAVSITTATTTQLVALSTGKKVYVCGFAATFGASSTLALEYGTGTACATGTTALTGVFTPATGGTVVTGNGSATVTGGPAGNALCALTTGTGGIFGLLTYVQQ